MPTPPATWRQAFEEFVGRPHIWGKVTLIFEDGQVVFVGLDEHRKYTKKPLDASTIIR